MIEEGIANLNTRWRWIHIMTMPWRISNLLIRERADLLDTKEQYAADVAVADDSFKKCLDVEKEQRRSGHGRRCLRLFQPSGSGGDHGDAFGTAGFFQRR